ncbi:MAG: magnesium transporter [Candidatus Micrarchaeota archaeon]
MKARHKRKQKPLYHETLSSIVLQAFPFLIISGVGALFAGIVLKDYLDYIHLFPGALVLIPTTMNIKGALASSLAARLGTAYHLGGLKGRKEFAEIRENLAGTLVVALITSSASAAFAYVVSPALGVQTVSLPLLLVLALAAGIAATLILAAITVTAVLLSVRLGVDPNNSSFPLLSTAGDFIVVWLVYATMVLLVTGA